MEKNKNTEKIEATTETKVLPNLFSDLAKVVGQMGAALAGIGLIVGTLGFFEDLIHDQKLGIDVPIQGIIQYIADGSQFLIITGATIMNNGFGLFLIPAGLIFIAALVSIRLYGKSLEDHKPNQSQNVWLEFSVITLLNGYLIYLLYQMTMILRGKTLYLEYGIEKSQLNEWIVGTDYMQLRSFYASLCTPVFLIIVILLYWYWRRSQFSQGFFYSNTISKVVCILLLIFSIVGLSLNFGIIMGNYNYPQVSEYGVKDKKNNFMHGQFIPVDTSGLAYRPDSLFLIEKTDKEMIFYQKTTFQIIYVANDIISYYKTNSVENVFKERQTIKLK